MKLTKAVLKQMIQETMRTYEPLTRAHAEELGEVPMPKSHKDEAIELVAMLDEFDKRFGNLVVNSGLNDNADAKLLRQLGMIDTPVRNARWKLRALIMHIPEN